MSFWGSLMNLFFHQHNLQTQEIHRRMSDPYETPGLDAGVDEAYHGIDHGMGIANPSHNDHDSGFGGGFGGGCGNDGMGF